MLKLATARYRARPTLAEVNEVLATFREPDEQVSLYQRPGTLLYLAGTDWNHAAQMRGDGTYFRHVRVHSRMGGTEEMATVQLVRWYRGMTRRPLRCWSHWCGHLIKLGRPDTMDLLRSSSYPDPRKTACVLCGSAEPGDWWSLDGVTGPYCGCRDRRKGG